MSSPRLFLYGPLLDPDLLAETAPGITFERIAHLPAHKLSFSESGTPVVVPEEGHTVWGGVFTADEAQIDAMASAHPDEESHVAWAVDREGDRFEVLVFSGKAGGQAGDEAVTHMVQGARHWELPAGWVVGLEDLLDPFEF